MSGSFPEGDEWCNGTSSGVSAPAGTAFVGGASNVKGSYVQIVASCPHDVRAILINLQETSNTTRHCFVDIAIGASGSEIVIISNLMLEGSTNGLTGTDYLFPVNIPAGTRIAARAQNGSTTADGGSVSLTLFDSGFMGDGFAGIVDIGSVTSTTYGSLLTAGTTPAKGSYTQLIASTAQDLDGFYIRPSIPSSGTASPRNLMDIAIGASGSEIIIVPDVMVNATVVPAFPCFLGPFWITIPTGTRMAARLASDATGATVGLQLYGIYK